jgi:hypothetical protein
MPTAQDIIDACEAEWDAYKGDCSGFAKAVAARLGVAGLTGQANDIVGEIQQAPWTPVAGGPAAAAEAANGRFVLAALKGTDQQKPYANGHVVVVVAGDLARGLYPTAYWGSLHGTPYKNTTLNYAWVAVDRDKVVYSVYDGVYAEV